MLAAYSELKPAFTKSSLEYPGIVTVISGWEDLNVSVVCAVVARAGRPF